MTDISIHPMLARLKQALSVKSDAALCFELGISTSGLSDLKRRNRLPWRVIVEYCYYHQLSVDRIVFGPCAFGCVVECKNPDNSEGGICQRSL